MNLEEQLVILDEQLEAYEPKQRWLIYLGTAVGILVMSWMFFVTDMLDQYAMLQDENANLVTQIQQNSPEAYRSKIAHKAEMIIQKEKAVADLKLEKESILLQMSQSQGLLFDNREYAKILDLLLERSVRLGVKIELMQSEDTDKVFFGKVKQFKTLTIKGSGHFRAIAAFLAFIESQKCLVEINNVRISADEEKPSFTATIFYMGVAL